MATIVKSVVADSARKAGVRVSADFYDALDKAVSDVISKAVKRAKDNNRKTLMPQDL
ncbi:MAG: DUF1931 domain-containing protein [Candidatus Micrarchaeota archaeon]|nr:DUF1931 domain-containing protein [Candidatus Micrarchaeota archaeon]